MNRLGPILIFLMLMNVSCSVYHQGTADVSQCGFSGIFENREMQQQYKELTNSVLKLSVFVSYQSQVFEPDSLVTLASYKSGRALGATRARFVQNESFSGSATAIDKSDNKILLLTCAHLVHFPDTIYTYDERLSADGKRYLLGLSVKTGFVMKINNVGGNLRPAIVAIDAGNDLALLEIVSQSRMELPVSTTLKLVSAKDLNWGDRIWLTGFPSGRFMMTTGLISNPDNKEGILFTDAPFSEGYSGAPALVYHRQASCFLLAGVGRSVAARSDYVLKPEKKMHETVYNTALPYTGQVYVEVEKQPAAGVTFIVGPDLIQSFMMENAQKLALSGWDSAILKR
ncbi:MAG: trypsin-like peptidase domain-containing protein [Lentimicrobiaceae bacterium]|nr:trypsin-like peptidase domain-containing protein [Lentimicrobiaceae bacterium]MCO5265930.1 serine protease [Lentimicrobium sp.]